MADVTNAVRVRLTEHAGTAALIGTRAYFGALPQNPTLPASIVQQISAPRNSAMGEDVDKYEPQLEGRLDQLPPPRDGRHVVAIDRIGASL